MRLTFGLTFAVAIAAATSVVAADACKLLKQGTNTFCAAFVFSSTATKDQESATLGPNNSFSINADEIPGSGKFSCPGRGFIEVHYVLSVGAKEAWYGKAPNGVVNGNGYGKGTLGSSTNLFKWTLTPGACH